LHQRLYPVGYSEHRHRELSICRTAARRAGGARRGRLGCHGGHRSRGLRRLALGGGGLVADLLASLVLGGKWRNLGSFERAVEGLSRAPRRDADAAGDVEGLVGTILEDVLCDALPDALAPAGGVLAIEHGKRERICLAP